MTLDGDALGYVEFPFPIPAGCQERRFAAQVLLANGASGETCSDAAKWSASNAVEVTVQ